MSSSEHDSNEPMRHTPRSSLGMPMKRNTHRSGRAAGSTIEEVVTDQEILATMSSRKHELNEPFRPTPSSPEMRMKLNETFRPTPSSPEMRMKLNMNRPSSGRAAASTIEVVPVQEALPRITVPQSRAEIIDPLNRRHRVRRNVSERMPEQPNMVENGSAEKSVVGEHRHFQEISRDIFHETGSFEAGKELGDESKIRLPIVGSHRPKRNRESRSKRSLAKAAKEQPLPPEMLPSEEGGAKLGSVPLLSARLRRQNLNAIVAEGPPDISLSEAQSVFDGNIKRPTSDLKDGRELKVRQQKHDPKVRNSSLGDDRHRHGIPGEESEPVSSGNERLENGGAPHDMCVKRKAIHSGPTALRRSKRELELEYKLERRSSLNRMPLSTDYGKPEESESMASPYRRMDKHEPEELGSLQQDPEGGMETPKPRRKRKKIAALETSERPIVGRHDQILRPDLLTKRTVPVPEHPSSDLAEMLKNMPIKVMTRAEWVAQHNVRPPALTPLTEPRQKFVQRGDGFVQLRHPCEERYINRQTLTPPSRTPLQLAVIVQMGCGSFYGLCHGFFGGLAMAHLIMTLTLGETNSTHDTEDFVSLYSLFCHYVKTLFAFFSGICLLSVFERYNMNTWAALRKHCVVGSGVGALIVICYAVTFLVNASASRWDDRLILQSANATLWESTEVAIEMAQWKVLTVVRCSGAILGGIFIALSSHLDLLLVELIALQDSGEMLHTSQGFFKHLAY